MTTPTSTSPTPNASNGGASVGAMRPPANGSAPQPPAPKRGMSRGVVALVVVGALVAGVAIGGVLFARSSSNDDQTAGPPASDSAASSSTASSVVAADAVTPDADPLRGGTGAGGEDPTDPAAVDPGVPRVQAPANVPGYSYSEPENSPTPLPPTLPVEVSVSSLEGLRAGDPINIRVVPTGGSETFGFRARLCQKNATIEGLYDFFPEVAPNCISAPLSANSDAYVEVKAQPPYQVAEGAFRVGLGTDTFTMDDGSRASVTCTQQDPCQLVLQVHVPYGFGYYRYDLSFA
jgi:hypothetical protein